MTYDKAKEILKQYLTEDGSLVWKPDKYLQYLHWNIHSLGITLDGEYSVEELEAIIEVVKQNSKFHESL